MKRQPGYLTFAWWNLHNFADYVEGHKANARWPKRAEHYQAKRDRVLAALGEAFGKNYPDLLAVCEITRKAADDLVGLMPQGFDVLYAPTYKYDDGFQVAAFYRRGIGLTPEVPLYPSEQEDLSDGTRPMIPLHLTIPGHLIRFMACHWTALDVDSSEESRERLADVLRRNIHAFLKPPTPKLGVARHIVVLGDLNMEPSSRIFEHRLIGRRDRRSTHARHWRDESVRKIESLAPLQGF